MGRHWMRTPARGDPDSPSALLRPILIGPSARRPRRIATIPPGGADGHQTGEFARGQEAFTNLDYLAKLMGKTQAHVVADLVNDLPHTVFGQKRLQAFAGGKIEHDPTLPENLLRRRTIGRFPAAIGLGGSTLGRSRCAKAARKIRPA